MVDISLVAIGLILVVIVVVFYLLGLTIIGRYEVGIRTRRMFGEKMPQGRIIA